MVALWKGAKDLVGLGSLCTRLGFRDNLGYRSGSRLFATLIEVAGDQAAMSNMVVWFNFKGLYKRN